MPTVISGVTHLAYLLVQDYYDTTYSDNFNSFADLQSYEKEAIEADLRAWHWERATALWPEQRWLQEQRCLLTLRTRDRVPRSTAQRRYSFVVRHRSRQVRLYL